jgi:hypothetical protein
MSVCPGGFVGIRRISVLDRWVFRRQSLLVIFLFPFRLDGECVSALGRACAYR